MCWSSREEEFKTKNQMKNKQTALKALLVAGIVGSMMEVNLPAARAGKSFPALPKQAARLLVNALTDAQQAALSSADGATLATAAAAILAATPVDQRAAMARAIASFVVTNKTGAAATTVVTSLVAAVPLAANSIIQVALSIAPSLQTALQTAMPNQVAMIQAAAAVAADTIVVTTGSTIDTSNPNTNSAS